MLIPNFSEYDYSCGIVTNTKTNKVMSLRKKGDYKLKDDLGNWRGISPNRIKKLCGDNLQLPIDAVPIKKVKEGYFIDPRGTIYSFSPMYPAGKVLKPVKGTGGYLQINLTDIGGKTRNFTVHGLMVRTFLLEDYVEKGLVCMHLDNNKINCHLNNLALGTYSQNNKDAYKDELNPGNGLKKP